jgi:hypothetical protein
VSEYIGAMPVLWVDVPDEPGPESNRSMIEKNSIALLSNRLAPLDAASKGWLGRQSPRDEIVRSGLWNLNYVNESYDPRFLKVLEHYVELTMTR